MFERNRIADTLRSAREKRGLTLEQAATAAGIPAQYVRLLEGEPNVRVGVSDELYLIPFFRKYASYMAIDAEELLPEFLGMVQQMSGDTSPPIRLSYRSRYASLLRPVAVLFTIGIAVMLLLRQTQERPVFDEPSAGDPGAPAAIAESSETATAVATPIDEVHSPDVSPTEVASPTPDATPIASPATSPGAHELTIAAKEDAWLSLAVDDQPAKQYLLRAGESRAWRADRFSLTVGNAGGVSLSLDGRDLPAIGRPGQVVRNLRFPESIPNPTTTPS